MTIEFRNSTIEPKEVRVGTQTDIGIPTRRSIIYDTSKRKQPNVLWIERYNMGSAHTMIHQIALPRQNSHSATWTNAYGMRLNKINWSQEHQYHMGQQRGWTHRQKEWCQGLPRTESGVCAQWTRFHRIKSSGVGWKQWVYKIINILNVICTHKCLWWSI